MKVIHKFTLPMAEKATLMLDKYAQVIRVDGVDGFLYLWAVVDTEAVKVPRNFLLFKTGAEMPSNIEQTHAYVGCGGIFVQMELMMYVWMEYRHD